MSVRLYGRVMGHGSHAQVTHGFQTALNSAGLLSGTLGLDVTGLDDKLSTGATGSALAQHGVFTGPLVQVDELRRSKHARRWVMVAPNSNWMPPRQIEAINEVATDVLVPSNWAAEMLGPLVSKPITVVPHGVHAGFVRQESANERLQQEYAAGQFRVLHCSTSERQRKGTWELLQAWDEIKVRHLLPDAAMLYLVLDQAAQIRLAERMWENNLKPHGVHVMARLDAAPHVMAEVLRTAHVVCQPSRSEAFGMIPIEALACGTPIVATACTGHAAYLLPQRAGSILIENGDEAPIDDGPGAVAPTVNSDDIRDALQVAHEHWRDFAVRAFDDAPAVVREWSWSRQLAPWLEAL